MRISLLLFSLALASLCLWPRLLPVEFLVGAFGLSVCYWRWAARLLARKRAVQPRQLSGRLIHWVSLSSRYGVALLAGLCFANFHGARTIKSQLPVACDYQRFNLVGTVIDLPGLTEGGRLPRLRFGLRIESIERAEPSHDSARLSVQGQCHTEQLRNARVQLYWYDDTLMSTSVLAGSRLALTATLRRPRGLVNPAGIDYQLRQLMQGWAASGSVHSARVLTHDEWSIGRLRDRWRHYLTETVADRQVAAVLTALSVGDRQALSDENRRLLQHTGTAHLLAISGLHVGLLAMVGYWLGRLLFAGCALIFPPRWLAYLNGRIFAAVVSVGCAGFYAALSGFALPTQRALIMVCAVHLSQLLARYWSLIDVWLLALALVLLVNPLQAADPGLYLSFGAVLVLLVRFSARRWEGQQGLVRLWHWVMPQWWVFIGLLPLGAALWGGISLSSVLANTLAIPWVSMVTVPSVLMGLALQWAQPLETFFVSLAAASVHGLLVTLMAIAHWAGAWGWLEISPRPLQLLFAFMVVIIVMLPMPRWPRAVAILSVCAVAALHSGLQGITAPIERRITVFDVGQGLAVLVEAGPVRILYDTGPPLGPHSTATGQIVLPYLLSRGIESLDLFIVSHADADHASGVSEILQHMTVARGWLGEFDTAVATAESGWVTQPRAATGPVNKPVLCHGRRWAVDNLGIAAIAIAGGESDDGNNASCVVLLQLPEVQILLPGDIGKGRELQLAKIPVLSDRPTLLVAPHHGSNSSSSFALLSQVAPAQVIVSAGYKNRYGHPHALVTNRFEVFQMPTWNTAHSGAVQYVWLPRERGQIRTWRNFRPRFWHDR
ncbi:DNA internalization-related competence protein ComEC/Rec2 [Simiduia aestuariiviva]|uniref:Competence protein ComEC n=1 Tax=Simiduia aestuariiviva TaxID=1510459 RepID=A0A839USI0_9GAMM|nr:DNA internalization-related competence protein ComEC/Rec2 [Simiduia aestuariiviva]MBB3168468.1 competence protein ComEC [Simiduia aestuariiviva]